MSQVHPVFLRVLLPKAAGEGMWRWGRGSKGHRRAGCSVEEGAGDSLLTPSVPADTGAIPRRVLRDADGLFDGSQQS